MDNARNTAVNKLLMRTARRAEKASNEELTRTFVPVEPLPTLLESFDNHVLYGRRGTGKTHLLKHLAETRRSAGDIALYIDLRTIGSSGGLYNDRSESVALRATHLLVDVVEEIHNQLYEIFLGELMHLSADVAPGLDALAEAMTEVRVVGETEQVISLDQAHERVGAVDLTVAGNGPKVTARRQKKATSHVAQSTRQQGVLVATVKFGPLGRALTRLMNNLPGRRLWILFDEWSSGVPLDLQPLLADLLRRSFFPVNGITVKIGALERQARFRENLPDGDYLGIDLGADTAASLDLDDFLVFQADRSHAEVFFAQLLYQHVAVLMEDLGYALEVPDADAFRRLVFAGTAFSELVRASEGVPRDALNITALAAAVASNRPLTARNIRMASRDYFLRDKEGKTSVEAAALLAKIVQRCVDGENRRLVLERPRESDNPLIQALYDNRILHRVQQGVTLDKDYSRKYDVYLVDYGCFVDILLREGGRAVSDGTDDFRLVNDEARAPGSPGLKLGPYVALPPSGRGRS